MVNGRVSPKPLARQTAKRRVAEAARIGAARIAQLAAEATGAARRIDE